MPKPQRWYGADPKSRIGKILSPCTPVQRGALVGQRFISSLSEEHFLTRAGRVALSGGQRNGRNDHGRLR
jgi:hypothetical protein